MGHVFQTLLLRAFYSPSPGVHQEANEVSAAENVTTGRKEALYEVGVQGGVALKHAIITKVERDTGIEPLAPKPTDSV